MINASLGAHYSGKFVSESIKLFWLTLLGISNKQSLLTLKHKLENLFTGQAVLTYKGRDAIQLALEAFGITDSKDLVLTQAFTCFAIEEAIIRAGATPAYVDLGKGQLNLTITTLEKAYKKHGKKIKAVLVQHSLGHSAQIGKIRQWCNKHSILLIEDLAQSFGLAGEGKPVGTFGDAVVFSFGRDKIIDAIAGGAVVFRTEPIKVHTSFLMPPKTAVLKDLAYPFFTWMIRATYELGIGKVIHRLLTISGLMTNPTKASTNTITSLPSSIASLTLLTLETFTEALGHRQKIGQLYLKKLAKTPLKFLTKPSDTQSGAVLRVAAMIDEPEKLVAFMRKHNIHLSDRWYRSTVDCGNLKCDSVYQAGQCSQAETVSKKIINLPTHQKINIADAEKIIRVIKKYFKN